MNEKKGGRKINVTDMEGKPENGFADHESAREEDDILADEMRELSEENDSYSERNNGDEKSSEQAELETVRLEAKENYNKYLRAIADLDNFKKRAVKERSDTLRYASEALARDIVEVVDNLELAVKQSPPGTNDELLKGVKMVLEQLVSGLAKHGVTSESCMGEAFDPEKQEALASVPSNNSEPGTIIEEYKKTYYIKDKLLRPGKVVVSAAIE